MPTWKTPVLVVAAVLLAVVVVLAVRHPAPGKNGAEAATASDDSSLYGDETRALANGVVMAIDGKKILLSSFRGKWLLINYWATWCGPCRMEMPSLNEIWKKQRPAGLQMLAVTEENPQVVWDFMMHQPPEEYIHFPVVTDPGGEIKAALQIDSIPRTVILNPRGQVVFVLNGATTNVAGFLNPLQAAGFKPR